MKAINFKGVNLIFGKDQPEVQPLPVAFLHDETGTAISCWELNDEDWENLKANGGKIYLNIWTYGQPLQPVLITTDLSDGIDLVKDDE